MRTFGVEEELMLLDARTHRPLPAGEAAVDHAARLQRHGTSGGTGATVHELTVELQEEQVEVVGPPCSTLTEQLAAIREGRSLADGAARAVGARAVALATPVCGGLPHLVPKERYRRIQQHGALLATDQLTCGMHVHVAVTSREEGVAVLDRIRVWLPVLLALSANSPLWYGVDSGFASYRYQAWTRWPTAGPCEVFGSAEVYDRHVQALLRSEVPLDEGMLYFDARLSSRFPTVEVRVADVCLDPEDGAVVAGLARALVETAARQWRRGAPPDAVGLAELQLWSWRASRFGLDGSLVSPLTGAPAPAAHVVAQLLQAVHPVTAEYDEEQQIQAVVARILEEGPGARVQRRAYAQRHDPGDVVDAAIRVSVPNSPRSELGPRPGQARIPGVERAPGTPA